MPNSSFLDIFPKPLSDFHIGLNLVDLNVSHRLYIMVHEVGITFFFFLFFFFFHFFQWVGLLTSFSSRDFFLNLFIREILGLRFIKNINLISYTFTKKEKKKYNVNFTLYLIQRKLKKFLLIIGFFFFYFKKYPLDGHGTASS